MSIHYIIFTYVFGIAACIGYCITTNVPKKNVLVATLVGALGWLTYQISITTGSTKPMAAFWAGCAITIASEICSEKFNEIAIIYIIPSIMPLVPGASMYYSINELINADYTEAAQSANETFFLAGAIALSILVGGSIFRLLHSIRKKL